METFNNRDSGNLASVKYSSEIMKYVLPEMWGFNDSKQR
jgi:hypothetical protein